MIETRRSKYVAIFIQTLLHTVNPVLVNLPFLYTIKLSENSGVVMF